MTFGVTTGWGASDEEAAQIVEASLKRLKTDYIDLLYLHMWDNRTPAEEMSGHLPGEHGNL